MLWPNISQHSTSWGEAKTQYVGDLGSQLLEGDAKQAWKLSDIKAQLRFKTEALHYIK